MTLLPPGSPGLLPALPDPPLPAPPGSDLLLARDRTALLAAILSDRTAYAPDWLPAAGGPGRGLADILAGEFELLAQRLARIPEHRQSVLLDLLGVSLLPAQGARACVLLAAVPGTRSARIPAGTRIGASVPGRDQPVVFETQDDVAVSTATVVEVHSVLPETDAEVDHSADVLAGRPFTLFAGATAVDRELFIGHDELLAFDGRAEVEVELGLAVPAAAPLPLEWTWWDGKHWRQFTAFVPPTAAADDDSVDGTAGLIRSGTVRLVAPCAQSVPLELEGRTTHWIRGRLTRPLVAEPGQVSPTISRVRLRVVNSHRRLLVRRTPDGSAGAVRLWWPGAPAGDLLWHVHDLTAGTAVDKTLTQAKLGLPQPLPVGSGHSMRLGLSSAASRPPGPVAPPPAPQPAHPGRVAFSTDDELTAALPADPGATVDVSVDAGLALDKAIADQRAVDLTRTFSPLGPSPARGTAFLFACATATRRAGTRVTLVLERPKTAAEEADELSVAQEGSVAAAKALLDGIIATLDTGTVASSLAAAFTTLNTALPTLLSGDPAAWYATARAVVAAALAQLAQAAGPGHSAWSQVDTARGQLAAAVAAANAKPGAQAALGTLGPTPRDVGRAIARIAGAAEQLAAGGSVLGVPRQALEQAISTGSDADVKAAETALNTVLSGVLAGAVPFLPAGPLPPIFATDPTSYTATVTGRITTARTQVQAAQTAVAAARDKLKSFSPTDLIKAVAPDPANQLAAPEVAWEYYDGQRWSALGVDGDAQVVALQASGSLRFTVPDDIADADIDGDVRRWLRARLAAGSYSHLRLVSWTDKSDVINFLPVVEPRAPMLDRVEVFYEHTSPARDAQAVVVSDDHDTRDLTAAVTWPGPGAAPFRPMPERAPCLYLGLTGELPADQIGIWLQLPDASPWDAPHRPVWEGYDGREWVRLPTTDGTDGLRRTGIVQLVWPGTAGTAGVTVAGARGTSITLLGQGAALRFTPGQRLVLSDLQGQEPVVVAGVDGETVTTRAALPRTFAGGSLRPAPPARFGLPRTWLRATFDAAAPAPELVVTGLAAHAVEVAQVETLSDELLGSGDGSPGQLLVSRRSPVAGDVRLEVRELDGDRADLDADVLTRTLAADGIDPATIRTVRDARTGRVSEVWVPWAVVPSLGAAGPTDRVFVVDQAEGRFLFGGAGHGRPLPEGRDNVRLGRYRTCGGAVGNVPAGSLTQLLSAVAVTVIGNPEPASGGADVERLQDALLRGPGLLRHRRLALTEADVAAIAVEASPAVVRARAVGAMDAAGRPAPGQVRVVIMPRDGTPRPEPGPALLALVHDAVAAASPAVATSITVTGASYAPVGVSGTVLPLRAGEAGVVRERVLAAVEEFLHPLRGGPEGAGWDFGRGVHISDLARVLEAVPGVDTLTDLWLTRDDVPVGDTAAVRVDQVVCAGPCVIRLGGGT